MSLGIAKMRSLADKLYGKSEQPKKEVVKKEKKVEKVIKTKKK